MELKWVVLQYTAAAEVATLILLTVPGLNNLLRRLISAHKITFLIKLILVLVVPLFAVYLIDENRLTYNKNIPTCASAGDCSPGDHLRLEISIIQWRHNALLIGSVLVLYFLICFVTGLLVRIEQLNKRIEKLKNPEPIKVGEDEVIVKVAVAIDLARYTDIIDIIDRCLMRPFLSVDDKLRMQFSGIIVGVGSMVNDRQIGDKVCGLVEGQKCTDFVTIPSWKVLGVPNGISIHDAASLPYVASVVCHSFNRVGKLMPNCSIMIYDGAGEFGVLAIQLAKRHGCTVFTTGKNERELQYCKEIGADYCIKYDKGFADYVMKQTNETGVDIVFDPFGDKACDSWKILCHGGTHVVVGPTRCDDYLKFDHIGRMRIKLIVLSIWTLPFEEQLQVIQELTYNLWPLFESGKLVAMA